MYLLFLLLFANILLFRLNHFDSVIDEKGTIQYLNTACERTSGFTKSELLGKNVKIMMPEEVRVALSSLCDLMEFDGS